MKYTDDDDNLPERFRRGTGMEARVRRTIAISNVLKEFVLLVSIVAVVIGTYWVIRMIRERDAERVKLELQEAEGKAAAQVALEAEMHRLDRERAEEQRKVEREREAEFRRQKEAEEAKWKAEQKQQRKASAEAAANRRLYERAVSETTRAPIDYLRYLPNGEKLANARVGAEYFILAPDPVNPTLPQYFRLQVGEGRTNVIVRLSESEAPESVTAKDMAALAKEHAYLMVRNNRAYVHLPNAKTEFTVSCPRKGEEFNPSREQFGALYELLGDLSTSRASTIFYEVSLVSPAYRGVLPIGEFAFSESMPEETLEEVVYETILRRERLMLIEKKQNEIKAQIKKKSLTTMRGSSVVPTRRLGIPGTVEVPVDYERFSVVRYSNFVTGRDYRNRLGRSVYRYQTWRQLMDETRRQSKEIEEAAEVAFEKELREARANAASLARKIVQTGQMRITCLE